MAASQAVYVRCCYVAENSCGFVVAVESVNGQHLFEVSDEELCFLPDGFCVVGSFSAPSDGRERLISIHSQTVCVKADHIEGVIA